MEVVNDEGKSRGSGQPHTPPVSTIPWVAVEEAVVPEFDKIVEFEEVNVENIVNLE